jgi:hypothetical protein
MFAPEDAVTDLAGQQSELESRIEKPKKQIPLISLEHKKNGLQCLGGRIPYPSSPFSQVFKGRKGSIRSIFSKSIQRDYRNIPRVL